MILRTNHRMRALVDCALTDLLLERKTLRQAAQQMHDDGVPLHVALRTLAGRKTCN